MGIKFNDSDLAIEWPEPYSLEGYIVSDKDKNLINFAEFSTCMQ